ncbi:hypothetical protein [Alistipes sp.]|uniref:hypothetical protein n=1 Tax=Alistipes sp. TaxID=1872444 RepID=UPI00132B78EE|nr:hypothetical protein [Alistipes sp.]MUU03168.1 hypothetical protein [Alistipes sp.]
MLHYMRPEEQRALIGLRGTAQRRRTDHHPRRRQRQGRAAQGHGDDRGVVDEDRGFNKTDGGLHFTSTPELARIARELGMEIHAAHKDTRTSNTVYILTRREAEGRKEE